MPLSLLVRHKPEQYGYLPDGETGYSAVADNHLASAQSIDVDIQVKQALRSNAFWRITLALMCQLLVANAVVTHVMPYLSSIGVARSTSSLVASATPVASICGRLGFGWLGDRLDKRRVTALGFALTGLGLLLFGYSATGAMWLLVPFLILFGTGWGGNITIITALVREYFGRGRFGTIYGLASGIAVLGNIAGAPLAGWVFDEWGSYQGIWFAFAGVAVAALVIVFTIPPLYKTIQPTEKQGAREDIFR